MLCLDGEVDRALKSDVVLVGLLGGDLIYEFNEGGDRNIPYPRVIFEEISNVPGLACDNVESASRMTYRVSVCAETNLVEIVNAVERVMISIHFVRHSAEPIRNMPMGIKGKVLLFITIRREKNMKKLIMIIVLVIVTGLGARSVKAEDITVDFEGKKSVDFRSSGETIKRLIEIPPSSGRDGKGSFREGDINKLCSITSDTRITKYWQISFGGSDHSIFAIVKSQDSLNTVWSKLKIAPEKPEVDFTKDFLVIIQPGKSITQYNYNLAISENSELINFTLSEYHTSKDSGWLIGQEPILAFVLPQTAKTINVEINRAPGSEGPYPK